MIKEETLNKAKVMTISFECITNTDMPWINTATFLTNRGEFTIDRNQTEYTYDSTTGLMSMIWKDIYIWDGDEPNYNIPDDFFEYAVLKELEVEDDAPAGYEIRCIHCYVEGKEIAKALEQPCEDCVSRAELKKWLDMNFSFGGVSRKFELFDRLDKELPSVMPTTKWIPVSKELPKEDGDYFVTVFIGTEIDTNKPVREVSKDYFSLSDGWSYYGEHVIAWQHLPESYEPESEGEHD